MRYKKFVLIPVLIILYILLAPVIFEGGFVPAASGTGQSFGGPAENVGVGQAVSVTVTRQYLGFITLPVYNNVYGDLSWVHTTFFMFVGVLTLVFASIEWRDKLWPGE